MDIDQLRTFLEVHRTRHFGRASRSLFITQSAISTRIKQLEEILGMALFTRKRNDIQLTPAGRRFLPSAEALVALWEEARRTIGGEEHADPPLNIGAGVALWDQWLPARLIAWRQGGACPALRCVCQDEELVVRDVINGVLDLGIVVDPPRDRGCVIRDLPGMALVLVASRPGLNVRTAMTSVQSGVVWVEWGRSFRQEIERLWPVRAAPVLTTSQARHAREWLLTCGGTAYLPRETVSEDLTAERLFLVADAPVHRLSMHALYKEQTEKQPLIDAALTRWN
ncbi:MAG: LysR family transcriptional regulator [Magnetococcales bacterium]|nr:LysR family transcriptional regulator [Magnetococcales bacterium]